MIWIIRLITITTLQYQSWCTPVSITYIRLASAEHSRDRQASKQPEFLNVQNGFYQLNAMLMCCCRLSLHIFSGNWEHEQALMSEGMLCCWSKNIIYSWWLVCLLWHVSVQAADCGFWWIKRVQGDLPSVNGRYYSPSSSENSVLSRAQGCPVPPLQMSWRCQSVRRSRATIISVFMWL